MAKVPNGCCPNHSTGVKLPDGFVVAHLHYVDLPRSGDPRLVRVDTTKGS